LPVCNAPLGSGWGGLLERIAGSWGSTENVDPAGHHCYQRPYRQWFQTNKARIGQQVAEPPAGRN
jgi:hypothetical protein